MTEDISNNEFSEEPDSIDFSVSLTLAGLRLDHVLVAVIPDVSRAVLAASIRGGVIRVDQEARKCSYRVKAGQQVHGALLAVSLSEVIPEPIDFPILYEDEELLVVAKPPGMVTHPGNGNWSGTLANGLVHYCAKIAGIGNSVRPGIVHRLDKDTSGVLVTAKTEKAHRRLVELFQHRQVHKEYVALVHGIFSQKSGRIDAAIGRHPVQRQKMAVVENGRFAATRWQVIEEYAGGYSLLRVIIETGRTHQIRVHMAALGHPVAGDTTYGRGGDNANFPRQMLHAEKLSFLHPMTTQLMQFSVPLWSDFQNVLLALKKL